MSNTKWPSDSELKRMRGIVSQMYGRAPEEVRVVASPYRICPLGAHIDHQGGNVLAMTINRGVLLGFVPSNDAMVQVKSGQFLGEVKFNTSDVRCTDRYELNSSESKKTGNGWDHFVKGAAYALKSKGFSLNNGIMGYIEGSEGLDSLGLSSSAAVGISYLLALEFANNLSVSPMENIEFDRIIENEYLGLKNGILDQSAILLSSHGSLMLMNCQTKEYKLIQLPKMQDGLKKQFKILLAFSGLRNPLVGNPGYNRRVEECQEAARILLNASNSSHLDALLCNVKPESYKAYKHLLDSNLAKRAEHYFSENARVTEGTFAWRTGDIESFGKLVAASGLSSIVNYECGCEPMIQLYEILVKAPGVFGARFSGAGFRGCCLAFVDALLVEEASAFVVQNYAIAQPQLTRETQFIANLMVCDSADAARTIL